MEDWSPQRWIWWQRRCYFFNLYLGNPKANHLPMVVSIGWFHFKLVGWGSRYKFHETLRPLFVGIYGNPFKTWSPRSNTNFDKSWMFWRCHDASVDIFMFFTAPKPVGVPYEKKKNKGWWKITPVIREPWKAPELEGPGICHDSFPHFYISLPADQRGVTRWNKVEQC